MKAPDGLDVHGQLFRAPGGPARQPAIVFVHGGPPRQMLLGWHYRFYYSNAYALNQYLASRGFVVLSVNYRLGIGYGYAFQQPDGGRRRAARPSTRTCSRRAGTSRRAPTSTRRGWGSGAVRTAAT